MSIALGLGSNFGPSREILARTVTELRSCLRSLRHSSLYQSQPISPIDQPDYWNAVVIARCYLDPEQLLALAKRLEMAAGREAGPRDGARPLDIDLLLYGDRTLDRPELRLPHPRLRSRRFVLEPLAEIAGEWPVPPDGRRVSELLRELPSRPWVKRVSWDPEPAESSHHLPGGRSGTSG